MHLNAQDVVYEVVTRKIHSIFRIHTLEHSENVQRFIPEIVPAFAGNVLLLVSRKTLAKYDYNCNSDMLL